jgi:hypothetical protein
MRTRLGRSSCPNVVLDEPPVSPVENQCLQEADVLRASPSTLAFAVLFLNDPHCLALAILHRRRSRIKLFLLASYRQNVVFLNRSRPVSIFKFALLSKSFAKQLTLMLKSVLSAKISVLTILAID